MIAMRKSFLFFLLLMLWFSCKTKEQQAQSNDMPKSEWTILAEQLRESPYEDSLYFKRAKFFFALEQFDSCIADVNKAIYLDSTVSQYYFLLSDAYLMSSQSKTALEVLDKSMKLFPDDVDTYIHSARLYLILKQHLTALTTLDQVYVRDKENAEAYYLAGHILYEMGDTARAIKNYHKATEINPDKIEAWVQLGDVYTEMGNERALACYDNAIRLLPSDVETMHNKAYAYQKFGKIKESVELHQKICNEFPNYEPAFYNLGLLYRNMDSLDLAISYFTQAIALRPSESSSYYHRGLCYAEQKKAELAKEDLKKSVLLNPKDEEAQTALKELR